MKIPDKLYRFRPLDEALIERELDALKNSYLYSPSFASMNDPMEAFYNLGDPADAIVNSMLEVSGKSVEHLYGLARNTISGFGLVSFSNSYENLPMWAYYASNFAGMCLEFETTDLHIGDFHNENVYPVKYERDALPAIGFVELANGFPHTIQERFTRKRIEWKHENEWRLLVGSVGRKYYLDDALRRVFLGPRVSSGHVKKICSLLDRRPVEILQGEVEGFTLKFHTIKSARPLEECEKIGAGRFDSDDALYSDSSIADNIMVPMDVLLKHCQKIALRPNLEELSYIGVDSSNKDQFFLSMRFKLRSGRTVYHTQYLSKRCELIEGAP
ncbi:DUF2971 domain-containing protein [Brucella pseudogrignonensis]|uniref:DUF2971 domain-containing protein n=1 Tax=Brucella pseudogrignonensis TaxID=419475 RepID=UPI001F2930A0|nr:DUF2971 domain-containing protein [Brucella pseudogrignonensis]